MTAPRFQAEPHPIVWPHTLAECERLYAETAAADEAAQRQYAQWFEARRRRIDQADEEKGEPFRFGFELPHWREADFVLGLIARTAASLGRLPAVLLELSFYILILLGGNRSAKSEYCAKRTVQSALAHPKSLIVCLSEDLTASRKNQQSLIWKYLPRELRLCNGKRDPRRTYHINYSPAGGFTLEKLVLPNGSEIAFKTYNQEPKEIEGWMLGCRTFAGAIGAWPDESCTVGWFDVLKRRCKFCGALMLWSFTPIYGMTPAIKEAVGDSAVTLLSLPSELLPDRENVTGSPKGTMPYVQQARTEGAVVLYFFSEFNPFGTAAGSFYDAVKSLCIDKPSEFVQRIAYGYTTDTAGRAFPLFGAWNVVREEHLPAAGTNYHLFDVHGSRQSPSLWVRVTPGNPASFYIYRDWPDARRYGEWAIPTTRQSSADSRKGADGDPGPAQNGRGWGVLQYKQCFQAEERINAALRGGQILEKDPYRRRVVAEFLAAQGLHPPYPTHLDDGPPIWLYEHIRERQIDPRAGAAEHAAEKGGTCLVWEYGKEQVDSRTGAVVGPRLHFRLANGGRIDEGITAINTLLFWDKEQPLDPVMNAPRLYVSERCAQVRWALENYTGLGGEDGACKDFIDMLRWLAMGDLKHIEPGAVKTRGGGSY